MWIHRLHTYIYIYTYMVVCRRLICAPTLNDVTLIQASPHKCTSSWTAKKYTSHSIPITYSDYIASRGALWGRGGRGLAAPSMFSFYV